MSTRRPNVPRAARGTRYTSSGQTGGNGAADSASDPSDHPGAQSRGQSRVQTADGVISAEVLHPDFGSSGKDPAGNGNGNGAGNGAAGQTRGTGESGSQTQPDSAAGPKGAAGPSASKPAAKSRLSAAARRASERDSAKFAVRQPVVSWNRQEAGSGTSNGTGSGAANADSNANGTASGAAEPVPAKSFSGRLLALAVVLVAMIVILAPTVQTYVEQRMEINALQQDIAAQQDEKERLTTQLSRWEDPAYIKQQARQRLFLVMPGETRYLVVGADEVKQPEQIPASPTGDEDVPWVDALFESIKRSATD